MTGSAGVAPRPAAPPRPFIGRIRVAPALWSAAALLTAGAALFPIATLLRLALEGGGQAWPHLVRNVLPAAITETTLFLVGIGLFVALVGTATAWLVAAYDFPGRKLLDWALLLPLAFPAYIVAYVYTDLLHPVGPVQAGLRAVLGISRPAHLPLPDIRSLGGAVMLFGLVLYPYVYLPARALFLIQSAGPVEMARTLGATPWGAFRRVALPLARPAIAIGTGLALMEALNDVGAPALLGVRPLTVAVYSVWINQSDLAGAAQLALVLLAFVLLLVAAEQWGRRRQSYASSAQRARPLQRAKLKGAVGILALAAGLVPVALGFLVPLAELARQAIQRISFAGLSSLLLAEAANTIAIAAAATALALGAGMLVAASDRVGATPKGFVGRLASVGYAVPGTVLALGLLPLNAALSGIGGGLPALTTGLATAGIVYAYAVRFLAIPVGGTEAGLARISFSLDGAARTLGLGRAGMLARIHLPLTAPAIAAAAALTFVDCMKELPIALMLRPMNVETLATHLYGEAIRGTYEDGAIAALLIVLIGLVPVVLLSRVAGVRSR